ncbi:MAG TPA: hypothetical protein VM097_12970 [Mycobacteriales bacterium]|nr:hypothetical protein [Mycobacteriales bacterium]
MPPPPTLDPAAALSQPFATKVFKPAFSVRLPANWTAVERDVSAFQAYLGDEDFEITFDRTYLKRESVGQGVARLSRTPGATPSAAEDVVVGGRHGKALVLQSDGELTFTDSGFHVPSGPIGVMVLPIPDGTTITVFLTARDDRAVALPRVRALTDRIFATLRWA